MKTGKRKKKVIGQGLGILLYLLSGAFCGLLIMRYLDYTETTGASRPELILSAVLLFVLMYAAMLIQIIIHETGHLVFGLLTGYRFSSFRIFSLMWIKENDHIRFKRMTVAGTGGQCLMIPPNLKDRRMPFILYNFGGAILNGLLAVICLGISFAFTRYSFGWTFCLLFAVFGFAFAMINGLPIRMGQVNNDGRNALDLTKSTEAIRAFWIQMKVNEQISMGIRVKDMPDEWFSVPSDNSMQNGIIAVIGVLACSRLMDQHRFREADDLMKRLLSQRNAIAGLHRNLLACDRMYVEMITDNRTDLLEKMRTKDQLKVMKAMKKDPSVLRTEYVYALLSEKNPERAENIRKQFEKAVSRFPYSGEIAAERELIQIAESHGEREEKN